MGTVFGAKRSDNMKLGDTSADPELALSVAPSYIQRHEDVSPSHYIKYWLCGECCLDTKDTKLIKHISAGAALLTFDILFFSTFAVGWILTAIFNPDGIDDNAITRVFGCYNICIGVDSNPARLVCIPMSYFSIFCFVICCLLHLQNIRTEAPGWRKNLTLLLLLAALLFATLFSWSIGIEPTLDDRESVKHHLYGFSLGLVGYCLLKVVSVIEFFRNRPEDFKPCGDGSLATAQWDNITFLTVEIVSMAFILGAAIFLAAGMLSKSDDELDELLALPTPTDTNFDFEGMGLVLVTMLGPPILCVFGPRRRHATLKFQYVKVDEEQQIADLTAEMQTMRVSMDRMQKELDARDTNMDGVVDQKEWKAAGGTKAQFAELDRDGDGTLDKDELEKHFTPKSGQHFNL